MTRKEAVKWLKRIRMNYPSRNIEHVESDVALHMAIKSLEQENNLNKIKKEIIGMYRVILKDTPKDDWVVRWNDCLDDVLRIIEKYTIESDNYDAFRNNQKNPSRIRFSLLGYCECFETQ